MVRATKCCSLLITVCLLLGLLALGNAQSDKRRPQKPRDNTVVPAAPTTSPSERRVALVIGNGQYQYVSRLDNPTNDARLIAETLAALGFTLVGGKAQLDLDKAGFDRTVQEFGNVIQGSGVALFYYTGHGVQVRGANYLVPVSANPTREADVDFQLLSVDLVLRQMESAGTRLNFLILDACRNNPFAGRGFRTAGGGLAQMQAPEGTLISYATQPGNVAQDGTDGHSPYAWALASTLRKPGLALFDMFNEIGLAVMKRTGGQQQPWVSSSPIMGMFYFSGAPVQPPAASIRPPPASPDGRDEALEIAFWNSIKEQKHPDAFRDYLQRYPQGKFASLARLKIKELTGLSVDKPPVSASSRPKPPLVVAPTPGYPIVTIQRYLTMEAPEEVHPDQEFAIQVALTMEHSTPEAKVVSGTTTPEGQLVLSLPAQDAWTIDVVMTAPDFTFRAGRNTTTVVVPRQGDSTPAVFYLRAKSTRGGPQPRMCT